MAVIMFFLVWVWTFVESANLSRVVIYSSILRKLDVPRTHLFKQGALQMVVMVPKNLGSNQGNCHACDIALCSARPWLVKSRWSLRVLQWPHGGYKSRMGSALTCFQMGKLETICFSHGISIKHQYKTKGFFVTFWSPIHSEMDLLTPSGFANALFYACNLKPGSGHMTAPVCSTFVFMSLDCSQLTNPR